MKTKVIKTKAEYQTVLARVEKLMDARPGTREGDELDQLAMLVHAYEEEIFPIKKADSGPRKGQAA